eukprot:CAMPEP_0114428446 /NCGR_PEP_ID=MMETSP0103-20121206/8928_1 /TAXON_ID=37642 ORGANISM="Paraphysomonas imperforata, Strain PA2" /NCGR_SAMPLE_ID=MMETSP0103 /ASSEMBLY_ACC=CAM_ASM_000201 /LENGTH=512 /DNA_ID=CAMNT_0001597659 /DNA_START=136 /DNA_END=1671 /DNA_ORIENTATION=+
MTEETSKAAKSSKNKDNGTSGRTKHRDKDKSKDKKKDKVKDNIVPSSTRKFDISNTARDSNNGLPTAGLKANSSTPLDDSAKPNQRRYSSPLRKAQQSQLDNYVATISNNFDATKSSPNENLAQSIKEKDKNRRKTHDGVQGRHRRDSSRDRDKDKDRERKRSHAVKKETPKSAVQPTSTDFELPTAKTLSEAENHHETPVDISPNAMATDFELPTASNLHDLELQKRRSSKLIADEVMVAMRKSPNVTSTLNPPASRNESVDKDEVSVEDEDPFFDEEHKYDGDDDELDGDLYGDSEHNPLSALKSDKSQRPPASRTSVTSSRRLIGRQGTAVSEDNSLVLNMFFKEVNKIDKLGEFRPKGNDPILESMSEIMFKPYPWPLQLFGALICFSQFVTLICLFYSLLPCPDEKPSWLVIVGVPLACAYAGIESIHHMLRYIHLGAGYRVLVFIMNLNSIMQLLCVGVVMGKSTNLLTLISNFVGVAVVLQIDEFLASYVQIKDIDTDLLGEKSW